MSKIIIIGPAHPLRGGLATFNQRLAREFNDTGHQCSIYSFSLQYPSFIFPGTTQYTDEPAPENLVIKTVINSINPFNWLKVGNRLKKEKPDLVIVRFWLPLMGPALGTILRRVRKNKHTRIICIADNVVPHEKRPGDKIFTRYFLKSCDAFITMSEKVMNDLRSFERDKPAVQLAHPLYDNFGEILSKKEARAHLNLPQDDKIILFFGFIRKYKGLDILLDAMPSLPGIRLLIAGEFYEDKKQYQDQIDRLAISSQLILKTDFIPDSEVKYYLCAADAVIQPYRNATQSGVTPLAYHFEKPMVVTNVGGLPSMVPDGKCGIVTTPDPEGIASAIKQLYETGTDVYTVHLRAEKKKLSWQNLSQKILELAGSIKR